jgi:hypothetical protein
MEPRKRVIDLDEIDAGLRSPLYVAIEKRLAVMIRQKTESLLQMKNPEETAHIRGYITAVQDCARVPAMLKAEIETRRKQNARNKKHELERKSGR